MHFRLPGPQAEETYQALTGDLADAEFALPKQVLADIAVFSPADGSISFGLEALTVSD